MLSGLFIHNIDDKGRVVLPARFRSLVGERFILTKGIHGCIFLFPEAEWLKIAESLGKQSFLNRDAILLQRFLLGAATECSPDPQGRLAIPLPLREYAGIKENGEVVIMGTGQRIEIWSKERWEKCEEEITPEKISQAAEQLGLFGPRSVWE